jgi:hypothetical protein
MGLYERLLEERYEEEQVRGRGVKRKRIGALA